MYGKWCDNYTVESLNQVVADLTAAVALHLFYRIQWVYTSEDLVSVSDGANLGLGCGSPQAIATF